MKQYAVQTSKQTESKSGVNKLLRQGLHTLTAVILLVFLGGCSSGTSSLTASAQTLPTTYIYPQASPYNALCNGTADDTAAIQSAINASVPATPPASCGTNLGGGIQTTTCSTPVMIVGRCMISTISLPSYATLVGESTKTSELMQIGGSNTDMITLPSSAFNSTQRITIQHLMLDGNKGAQTAGNCINFTQPSTGSGIRSPRHVIDDVRVENCYADGIHISADTGSDILTNIIAYNNGNDGVYFHAGDSRLQGIQSYGNGNNGIELWGGDVELSSSYAWANQLNGFWIYGGANRVENDSAQDNGHHGFEFDQCNYCVGTGLYADSNGTSGAGYAGLMLYDTTYSHFTLTAQGISHQSYGVYWYPATGNKYNTVLATSGTEQTSDFYSGSEIPDANSTVIVNGLLHGNFNITGVYQINGVTH
jgi:uncharacterized protein YcfL